MKCFWKYLFVCCMYYISLFSHLNSLDHFKRGGTDSTVDKQYYGIWSCSNPYHTSLKLFQIHRLFYTCSRNITINKRMHNAKVMTNHRNDKWTEINSLEGKHSRNLHVHHNGFLCLQQKELRKTNKVIAEGCNMVLWTVNNLKLSIP